MGSGSAYMERTGTSRSCIRRPLIKRCRGSWSLAATPAGWRAAGSEIVALAPQAAVPDNGQRIPDEADLADRCPEGSLVIRRVSRSVVTNNHRCPPPFHDQPATPHRPGLGITHLEAH